jgi:hypothetical protein
MVANDFFKRQQDRRYEPATLWIKDQEPGQHGDDRAIGHKHRRSAPCCDIERGQPVSPRFFMPPACMTLMTKSTTSDLNSTIEGISMSHIALHLKVVDLESHKLTYAAIFRGAFQPVGDLWAMAVLFISHSSADDEHASAIERWLIANGFVEVFVDHESIAGGDKWREALRAEANSSRVVVCLVSESWLSSVLHYLRGG